MQSNRDAKNRLEQLQPLQSLQRAARPSHKERRVSLGSAGRAIQAEQAARRTGRGAQPTSGRHARVLHESTESALVRTRSSSHTSVRKLYTSLARSLLSHLFDSVDDSSSLQRLLTQRLPRGPSTRSRPSALSLASFLLTPHRRCSSSQGGQVSCTLHSFQHGEVWKIPGPESSRGMGESSNDTRRGSSGGTQQAEARLRHMLRPAS